MPMLNCRVSDEVAAALDAARGSVSRSDFMREAIESRLTGERVCKTAVSSSEANAAVYGDGSPDGRAGQVLRPLPPKLKATVELRPGDMEIVDYLRGRKGGSERQIVSDLGWPAMRVGKAVSRLLGAGLIAVASPGFYVVADE